MGRPRFDPRNQQRGGGIQVRVNHRIRVPEVRVITEDGTMLGVMATHEALKAAQERGLDLVEINPKTDPPVCKILDFGKYKYEEKKRQAEAKRKQTVVDIKEVKVRPKTDDHDMETKLKHVRKFLEAGHKVKVTCRFRGREITHPERAREQLLIFISKTDDIANLESNASMEGKQMNLLLAPKQTVLQKVAASRIAAEKARQQAEKEGRSLPSAPSLPSLAEVNADVDDDDDDDDDDDSTETNE